MADRVIPLTGRSRDIICELLGMSTIVFELQEAVKGMPTLPGLNLALAVAQKIEAEQRVKLAGTVLRTAAAAGVDIVATESVYSEMTKDGPVIRIKDADLLSDGDL